MKRLYLIACIAYMFVYPLSAYASECKENMLLTTWFEKLQVVGDPDPLNEIDKQTFLHGFNNWGERSFYKPKYVYLFFNGFEFMAVFTDGECVSLLKPLDKDLVISWMSGENV